MHGVPSSNRKAVEESSQTLTNGLQELLFFGSGSGLGYCRLGKKYLKFNLTVMYFASRG